MSTDTTRGRTRHRNQLRRQKADPSAQQRLWATDHDTTLTQLAHRRANLPELAELERLAEERTGLRQELTAAQVDVDALDRDIARLERTWNRSARRERWPDWRAAWTGAGTDGPLPRDRVPDRRQRELEDSQLELMERRNSPGGPRRDHQPAAGKRATDRRRRAPARRRPAEISSRGGPHRRA